jgi:hypothetical protein
MAPRQSSEWPEGAGRLEGIEEAARRVRIGKFKRQLEWLMWVKKNGPISFRNWKRAIEVKEVPLSPMQDRWLTGRADG